MEIIYFHSLQTVQFELLADRSTDRTLPKKMFGNECWEHFSIKPGRFFDISDMIHKSQTCNINRIYSTSTIL